MRMVAGLEDPTDGEIGIGERVEIRYMDFWKVRDGKIVDNWVMVDFPLVVRCTTARTAPYGRT